MSVDLIYGSPRGGLQQWSKCSRRNFLRADHISRRTRWIVEDGTKLAAPRRATPDEDLMAVMLTRRGRPATTGTRCPTTRAARTPQRPQPRLLAQSGLVGAIGPGAHSRERYPLVECEAPGALRAEGTCGESPAARECWTPRTTCFETIMLMIPCA